MTKSQKIGCVLIITAFLLGCALCSRPIAAYSTRVYNVAPGDTLWSIAGENRPPDMDIRAYVRLVERINGVDSRLWPGQALMIPIWEE